jgi:succinyl-CoA synthetase beta subunit
MNLHEYQAKEILKKYGIPVPEQRVIAKIEEVPAALSSLGVEEAVLKVQIHAGGRGKAGGVKLAKGKEKILAEAKALLGMKIVNGQTGKEGVIAEKVLISPISAFDKEYYLGAVIDRKSAQAILIASPEGGVEIEEVAAQSPEKILKLPIPQDGKMRGYQLWEVAKFMGWEKEREQGMHLVKQLAKVFIELDASLLEINPLVRLKEGGLLALDAKLAIDDNALFRHRELAEAFDARQLPPLEAEAREFDLAYIALDGSIGCMVNGAGLAMATMDIIEYYGGKPANFLDVGGGATKEKVAQGFKILLKDPKVKAILVNIFGGIMNCETLSEGIVSAAREEGLHIPLVVRMEGTNVERGREILAQSGLTITVANGLAEAAESAVKAVK